MSDEREQVEDVLARWVGFFHDPDPGVAAGVATVAQALRAGLAAMDRADAAEAERDQVVTALGHAQKMISEAREGAVRMAKRIRLDHGAPDLAQDWTGRASSIPHGCNAIRYMNYLRELSGADEIERLTARVAELEAAGDALADHAIDMHDGDDSHCKQAAAWDAVRFPRDAEVVPTEPTRPTP